MVEPFAAADCSGAGLEPAAALAENAGDTGGWMQLAGVVEAPPGSAAVLVSVVFDAGSASDFTAHVDNVHLRGLMRLFGDDFETGDLGAWSLVVGQ